LRLAILKHSRLAGVVDLDGHFEGLPDLGRRGLLEAVVVLVIRRRVFGPAGERAVISRAPNASAGSTSNRGRAGSPGRRREGGYGEDRQQRDRPPLHLDD
jgi:hypothetical protein